MTEPELFALKLGKKPARKGSILWRASTYLNLPDLPKPPEQFGNFTARYGKFANDLYANCVWAGAANEHIDWYNDIGRTDVRFTDETVNADYAAVTGFDPNDPESDKGTDMGDAASYRRRVGILAADGSRHRIDAYVRLPLRRLDWLTAVAYLLGGVGFGFKFPNTAEEQFHRGQPWSVVKGALIKGGHYVPLLGRRNGRYVVEAWGRIQEMTDEFALHYMDELIAYLDLDRMKDKLSPEGYNEEALRSDISACGTIHGIEEEEA